MKLVLRGGRKAGSLISMGILRRPLKCICYVAILLTLAALLLYAASHISCVSAGMEKVKALIEQYTGQRSDDTLNGEGAAQGGGGGGGLTRRRL
ncbi:unnamed protein product [Vitrella brassicaformis CCMP3155]|uniref:Uncharacterized protein n=1 Tax=Vitrella brassicaformis (strain CCMP3155) TaxID=1169540 RepID=A0A0G4EXS4_VITBC|nr:unnamed protein product [Vitrella brassicaformis CCMP3155]|eukprot:CEM03414.1 unnamed protein product [Vitrella brassicaformis CCMP3155]